MAFNVNAPQLDPSILTPGQSMLNRGVNSFQQGLKLKDELHQRKFMSTLSEVLPNHDYTTSEGQKSLVTELSQKGFGPEAMDLASKFPKQQATEYDFINRGEGGVSVGNKSTGEAKEIYPRDTSKLLFEQGKTVFDQKMEEKRLKQSGSNISKDNEVAAQKLEIARQGAEISRRKEEQDFEKKNSDRATVEAKADESVNLIDQMIGNKEKGIRAHPGLNSSVGQKGGAYLFGLKDEPIAGTSGADFKALLDQVKGGAFLEAVQSMRGSGALSEIEGTKAQIAIARMKQSQSESEFIKAAGEYRDAISNRKKRTLNKFDTREGKVNAGPKLVPKSDGSFDYVPGQ